MEEKKDYLFKKGQSGNPSGRPKLPEDVVEGRKLNKIEVARIFNRLINMPATELKDVLTNPDTKAMELIVGKIIAEGIKHGDAARLNFILDRMIGKVVDKVELSGEIKNEVTVVDKDVNERIKSIKGEE